MLRTIVLTVLLLVLFLTTGCATSEAKPLNYQADDEIVVLALGLGRSDWAMWRFAKRLENANYKVCLLDLSLIHI